MGFVTVEFENLNEIAVVPSCWITGSKEKPCCRWPDHIYKKNPSKFRTAIKSSQQPDENFVEYPVKILKKFDSLEIAQAYAKKIEKEGGTSTQSSERSLGRGKRKTKANSKYCGNIYKRRRVIDESDSDETSVSLLNLHASPLSLTNNFNRSQEREEYRALSPKVNIIVPETEYDSNSGNSENSPILRQNISHTMGTRRSLTPNINIIPDNIPNTRKSLTEQEWTLNDVIKNQIKIINLLQNVKDLLSQKQNKDITKLPSNMPITLPISSVEDFEKFEIFLTDEENMHKMMDYLTPEICTDLKMSIIFQFKKLLSDDVARKFNFFGKMPKKKFQGSNLDKLIYYTTRSVHSDCDRDKYKPFVMNWLKYGSQRLKNKRKFL